MEIYERIRSLRQLKGWSQEEIAHLLDMSVSGYGSIERGEVDVSFSRLQDIAKVFDMNLSDLLNFNEKNISIGIGKNHHISNFHSSYGQYDSKQEIEKLTAIISHQEKEIACLREIIELLKKSSQTKA